LIVIEIEPAARLSRGGRLSYVSLAKELGLHRPKPTVQRNCDIDRPHIRPSTTPKARDGAKGGRKGRRTGSDTIE
jgi:hypothetical protein